LRTIISFLLLPVLWMQTALAQSDTLNKTDEQGKKQGYWVKYTASGNRIYEGRFFHDIPTGEFRYYHENGKLKAISVFTDSGQHARTRLFNTQGKMIAEGNYQGEKKDSLWRYCNGAEGYLVSDEQFHDGLKHGISHTYYPDGKVMEVISWVQDLQHGEWIQYHSDGSMKLKGHFEYGLKQGPFEVFDLDGSKLITGAYADGLSDGEWRYYDESEKLIQREVYDKGALVTTEVFENR